MRGRRVRVLFVVVFGFIVADSRWRSTRCSPPPCYWVGDYKYSSAMAISSSVGPRRYSLVGSLRNGDYSV